jgi:hypothetical protein
MAICMRSFFNLRARASPDLHPGSGGDDLIQISLAPGEWHTKQGYAPTTCADDIMTEVDLWSRIARASRAQATS